jgi:hypothetical protein
MVFLDRIFSKTNAADFFAFLTPIDAPRHDMIDCSFFVGFSLILPIFITLFVCRFRMLSAPD